jgi:hypothetical protein
MKISTFVLNYKPKKKYITYKIIMSQDNHQNIVKNRIEHKRLGGRNKIMPRYIPTTLLNPSLNRVVII